MIESALTRKNFSLKLKITIKSLISVGLIALAVGLPQLVHLALGAEGGVRFLPMYLPVLLGGCLLGPWWGLGIGVCAPLVSFLLTLPAPMPAAARLPYMTAELAVFAAISGAFSKKIYENGWMAFPAVLLAAVTGRAGFLFIAFVFQWVSPLSFGMAWQQVQAGLLGLVFQAVIVPFAAMGCRKILEWEKK